MPMDMPIENMPLIEDDGHMCGIITEVRTLPDAKHPYKIPTIDYFPRRQEKPSDYK